MGAYRILGGVYLDTALPIVDIGILTIREDEFESILKVFPTEVSVVRARREYAIREADLGNGQKYNIAVVRQLEQGNGESHEAARDLIDDFAPSLVLVVGIAGAIPSNDLTLGDVILSSRIHDFSVEARKYNDDTAYSISGGAIAKSISNGIAMLSGRKEMSGWHKGLQKRPSVLIESRAFYGPKKWQENVRQSMNHHFGKRSIRKQPIFVTGQVASSDRLVKDPEILIPFLQAARHTLAVEMESGGVFRAARDRCPMLAIRGISDVVGFKRSESWTKFACASAAALTKAYLGTTPVEPKDKGTDLELHDRAIEKNALYLNLVEVTDVPEKIFIAPASVTTQKQAWAKILHNRRSKKPIPNAWCLHSNNIYSFIDPSGTPLEKIIDDSALEEHATADFFSGADPDKRHLFAQLLRRTLQDDLGKFDIRFFADDYVYAFMGWPGEKNRTFRYRNVHQESEITVVSHKPLEMKKGATRKTAKRKKGAPKPEIIRHTAFSGRFLQLEETWYLEITPTYRFTFDGKKKGYFHEKGLKGIKQLEKNRAVLSQVLLWVDLLCTLPERIGESTLLKFKRIPPFEIEAAPAFALAPTPSKKTNAKSPKLREREVDL